METYTLLYGGQRDWDVAFWELLTCLETTFKGRCLFALYGFEHGDLETSSGGIDGVMFCVQEFE